ncbi:unnamed protein product, partial [Polarella glacialis]
LRDYLQAGAVVGGTLAMSLARTSRSSPADSAAGALFIVASLCIDGLTGGLQQRMLQSSKADGVQLRPYVLMLWTNVYQALSALAVAALLCELGPAVSFLQREPLVLSLVLKLSICSALGQSFIFYTIAEFDPLTLAFITTTRKVFSVLLSIFLKGHHLNLTAWFGVAVVFLAICSELQGRYTKGSNNNNNNINNSNNSGWTANYRLPGPGAGSSTGDAASAALALGLALGPGFPKPSAHTKQG